MAPRRHTVEKRSRQTRHTLHIDVGFDCAAPSSVDTHKRSSNTHAPRQLVLSQTIGGNDGQPQIHTEQDDSDRSAAITDVQTLVKQLVDLAINLGEKSSQTGRG